MGLSARITTHATWTALLPTVSKKRARGTWRVKVHVCTCVCVRACARACMVPRRETRTARCRSGRARRPRTRHGRPHGMRRCGESGSLNVCMCACASLVCVSKVCARACVRVCVSACVHRPAHTPTRATHTPTQPPNHPRTVRSHINPKIEMSDEVDAAFPARAVASCTMSPSGPPAERARARVCGWVCVVCACVRVGCVRSATARSQGSPGPAERAHARGCVCCECVRARWMRVRV